MAKKNFYAIRLGHECNVMVGTWKECQELTSGYPGAVFKGFSLHSQAILFLDGPAPEWAAAKEIDTAAKEPRREKRIPPTSKKDRFGYFKPRYYRSRGVLHADYGTITGEDYVPYTGDPSIPPWLTALPLSC